jgi:starch synthase (maltosyl-transferring)
MTERPPQRVVIRGVNPEIECGRFPVKRIVGDRVIVEADIFADGHDTIAAVIRYRHEDEGLWSEIPMQELGNDHWRAEFTVQHLGEYIYAINAWVDPVQTWFKDFLKRVAAGQDVGTDLQIGALALECRRGTCDRRGCR